MILRLGQGGWRCALLGCIAALLVCGPAAAASPQPAEIDPTDEPLRISSATARQAEDDLIVTFRMAEPLSLRGLRAIPPAPGKPARYLCFRYKRGDGATRICIARIDGEPYIGRTAIGGDGKIFAHGELPGATASRHGRVVKVEIPIRRSNIGFRKLRWRAISSWSTEEDPCRECIDQAPESGLRQTKLEPPRIVGCEKRGRNAYMHGSRKRHQVALTFDDGPGPYTAAVERILNRFGIPATFFVVGDQVRAEPGRVRHLFNAGYAIANHSSHHSAYPSRSDLASTNRAIRAATGFTPCTFRPPYGAINSATVDNAASLGMATILWDVDPTDWATPGAGTIQARVLDSTTDGSIILLHDAGGDRSQTVAALPGIIGTLRQRGYRFRTVPGLLGFRAIREY